MPFIVMTGFNTAKTSRWPIASPQWARKLPCLMACSLHNLISVAIHKSSRECRSRQNLRTLITYGLL